MYSQQKFIRQMKLGSKYDLLDTPPPCNSKYKQIYWSKLKTLSVCQKKLGSMYDLFNTPRILKY